MKTCTKCNQEQPLEEFCKHKGRKDGYNNQCKSCTLEYREANRKNAKAYNKNYYQRHKERIHAQRLEYVWSNPQALIARRLRRRMGSVIDGMCKVATSMELLGCSREHVREHLESLFQPGMKWGDRHVWEIDHILPCAAFDLEDPWQQRKCFHWTNLQPLWAADNTAKSDTHCPKELEASLSSPLEEPKRPRLFYQTRPQL